MKKDEFSPPEISGLSKKVLLFSKPFVVRSLLIFGLLLISISSVLAFCFSGIINKKRMNKEQLVDNDSLKITLEDFDVNLNHPYYEGFSKNPYQDLIKHVYFHNRKKALESNKLFDRNSPAKIITDQGPENSLIFTIQEGGKIWYDTLQNFVDLDEGTMNAAAQNNEIGYFQPIGVLPKGARTMFDNNNKKSLKIGLRLDNSSNIKIEILNAKEEVLKTLVEKKLSSGKHRFEWSKKGKPYGDYWIDIFVNGKKVRQKFPIGEE